MWSNYSLAIVHPPPAEHFSHMLDTFFRPAARCLPTSALDGVLFTVGI